MSVDLSRPWASRASWDRAAGQFSGSLIASEQAEVRAALPIVEANVRRNARGSFFEGGADLEQSLGAERFVSLVTGLAWTGRLGQQGDADVGRTIDVKHSRRASMPLCAIPRNVKPDRVYVLVTGDAWRYTARGWLPGDLETFARTLSRLGHVEHANRHSLRDPRWSHAVGSVPDGWTIALDAPRQIVPQSELRPFGELLMLLDGLRATVAVRRSDAWHADAPSPKP